MTDDALQERHRMEQFAHAVAFGTPLPHALRLAGYEVHSVSFAFQMMQREEVQDIIRQDREWLREKNAISIEQIAAQLDCDRAFAYSCENPSAAVTATMSKAKIYGIGDPQAARGAPKRVILEWDDGPDPLTIAAEEAAAERVSEKFSEHMGHVRDEEDGA